jgi:putative transcriptional regulator
VKPTQPQPSLAKGKFLVASRGLSDPNFAHTVVLLLDYDEGGAMGVIINRPTDVKLKDVLPEVEELESHDDAVYMGGPVALNYMLFLVRSSKPPEDGVHVFERVYVSSSRDELKRQLREKSPRERFRFYAGHAGWAPGQLDAEVAAGGWHVMPADADAIFEEDPSKIWRNLIGQAEGEWAQLGVVTK